MRIWHITGQWGTWYFKGKRGRISQMHFYVILRSLPIPDDRGPSSIKGRYVRNVKVKILIFLFMYVSSFDSINLRTIITTTLPLSLTHAKWLPWKQAVFCFVCFFVVVVVVFKLTQSNSLCPCIWIGTKLDWLSFGKLTGFSRYPFCFIISFVLFYFSPFLFINYHLSVFKTGHCAPNQKLACFAFYFKIIETFKQ